MLKSPTTRAYAMLTIVMLLWAGNSIVGRAVRDDIPALTLAWFRWSGALLILLPFAFASLKADRAVIRAHWKPILLLGLLGVAAFNALLYSGLRYTPASNAMLIQAAIPALVLLFDRLLFRERPRALQLLGVTASTLGVLFVVVHGDFAALLALRLGPGELLVLLAVSFWALYTSLLRLRPEVSPLSFLAVTFAIGALAMSPLALWEASAGRHVVWQASTAGAIFYVAIFPSLIAYLLFNLAVTQLGGARAGQFSTLLPLFGAFLAAFFLGETLHLYHFAGMALILGGIAMTALSRPKAPVAAS
ncbi:DMT family transporter [Sphingomonas sp. G-3-2-10]|uniref:DMT family transporter n=1 Tax=Sphingomonas sp. G-3-2-10 TaxID=2728838 RepID=UPI00146DF569|nr:DMT family transporter [Sphingomonas sp. G-3-2-10]NML07182.1 DMT family transporter [Sphingomonas sp. G-3-2-10]